ncbi:MAG: 5-methylthioadenosine/S-adenosylhomocysteine deaminase [Rhodothermales bacterium]|jgi:5-methylthioadenosine/S-adenosylhomocysteine deaminase
MFRRMNSLLIRNAIFEGSRTDIHVQGSRIAAMGPDLVVDADDTLDASGKAVLPGLLNGHTHAAMTLMRGYADDMLLHDWLQNKIWPLEAHVTEEDVYWGTKLACLEMIRTGCTFFNDMYWHWPGSVRAVDEMGLRASLAGVMIDLFDPERAAAQKLEIEANLAASRDLPERIQFTLGPHAIYTVSCNSWRWLAEFAKANDLLIHTHLSETEKEVEDCIAAHGKRPAQYLADLGVLGPHFSVAHAIWLDADEMALLADHGVGIITNTCANMKLATGVFRYSEARAAGLDIGIGTDGVCSNNSLDIFEEMKFASLIEKSRTADATAAPAAEILDCATVNTAKIFRIDAGEIAVGKLADLMLLDLAEPVLTPLHNLASSVVYACTGYQVDSTICDGKVLMRHRVVPGEAEIRAGAAAATAALLTRANG